MSKGEKGNVVRRAPFGPVPSLKALRDAFCHRRHGAATENQVRTARRLLDGRLDPTDYLESVGRMPRYYNMPGRLTLTLEALNVALGTYGVEALWAGGEGLKTCAEYLNVGDPYEVTLLWDRGAARFILTTYGGWMESKEKRGARFA